MPQERRFLWIHILIRRLPTLLSQVCSVWQILRLRPWKAVSKARDFRWRHALIIIHFLHHISRSRRCVQLLLNVLRATILTPCRRSVHQNILLSMLRQRCILLFELKWFIYNFLFLKFVRFSVSAIKNWCFLEFIIPMRVFLRRPLVHSWVVFFNDKLLAFLSIRSILRLGHKFQIRVLFQIIHRPQTIIRPLVSSFLDQSCR